LADTARIFDKTDLLNRFNWTCVADSGKKHHIGLMHGAKTGHLLIYCNSRIMVIDFHVLEDSSYSFFIDEELCEISIEKKEGQFYYGFEFNRTADTPLNRERQKIEKRHLMQSLLVLGGLALVIIIIIFGTKYWSGVQDKVALADKLAQVGEETSATVLIAALGERKKISYFFLVDGKAYTMEEERPKEELILLETGMPLEKGDEFIVRYIPENPRLHLLDYARPTPRQIGIYKKRAIKEYKIHHPDRDTAYISCLTDIAFEMKGIAAYADFYFQATEPLENPHHNTQSFKRLVRDQPFQNEVARRCQSFQ